MNKLGARRLLKLADILEKADALHKKRGEPTYKQRALEHACGTPACAWGHYVFSVGKAKHKRFMEYDSFVGRISIRGIDDADDEFGLTYDQREELFGTKGCNEARTAKDAAAYIRAFVAREQKVSS